MTIKIEGLRELEDALRELPKATGKLVLRRALIKAGEPVRAAAEALAPVPKDGSTPHLKPSITVSQKLSRRQKQLYRAESPVEVFIGPAPLPEAHLQEFGSSVNSAQPYMRPAWDTEKNAVLDSVKKDLTDEIEKARQRLARKAERLALSMKS